MLIAHLISLLIHNSNCVIYLLNQYELNLVSLTCEYVSVSNAAYATCDGEYQYMPQERVSWALDKPVYKELQNNRYILWTEGKGFGSQWVIGSDAMLTSGSYFHKSKLS